MTRLLRRKISYANLAATLAVVLAMGGTSYAAVTITGQDVKDATLTGADVRDGSLQSRDLAANATDAVEGPGFRVVGFSGLVPSIAGNSGSYVFAGPSASVTIDDNDRLTGAASAPLGTLSGASNQTADVGLCYQNAGGRGTPAGTLVNFVGASFSAHFFPGGTRESIAVSATTRPDLPPPAGTYNVGMCVRKNGNNPISNNNFVNGWVMVSDQP